MTTPLLREPALDPAEAVREIERRLALSTDVSDVATALADGTRFALVDSRDRAAWDAGHVDGAIHLPTAEIATRAGQLVPRDVLVVTYCWSPACNGATRAALEFARLGYRVKEMWGGWEYWVREGFATVGTTPEHRVGPVG